MTRTDKILAKIDEHNALDPNLEEFGGEAVPAELIYGKRMTEMILLLNSQPSEALMIAARAQHIERWKIARSTFDSNREGYLRWRNELKKFHASTIKQILLSFFCEEELISRVVFLVQKKDFKHDAESQSIEDAACLVFLKYYFQKFAKKTEHAKMVDILKKSWGKMSNQGHEIALSFSYGTLESDLLKEALNG